ASPPHEKTESPLRNAASATSARATGGSRMATIKMTKHRILSKLADRAFIREHPVVARADHRRPDELMQDRKAQIDADLLRRTSRTAHLFFCVHATSGYSRGWRDR